jgi:hypothetical protein
MNVMTNNARSGAVKPRSATTDGVDHINIGNDAKTELGQLLAHFTESHFTHPYLGSFNCMEGYWHYVRAEHPDDKLRLLVGRAAYLYGKKFKTIRRTAFREIIMDGNYQKIVENDRLRELLVKSTLPFMQYFAYGPEGLLINPPTAPWLVPDFERLRELFKSGEPFKFVPYESYQLIG